MHANEIDKGKTTKNGSHKTATNHTSKANAKKRVRIFESCVASPCGLPNPMTFHFDPAACQRKVGHPGGFMRMEAHVTSTNFERKPKT